jgi:hypothetical protein
MNKKTKATHWVLAHGKDCDGHNSGHIYAFDNEKDANDCGHELNSWSDGLRYFATSNWSDVEEYCDDYNKDSSRYKTIYST